MQPRQTFRRTNRLSKTRDFSAVFAFRKALRSEHFQLLYHPTGLGRARFAVVVAKRMARLAVERNHVKRLAREAFRIRREELPGCDLVVRLASNLNGVRRSTLRAEVDDLLRRLQE